MHSYNKFKDLDHLFIICGAVYASCISRNSFKALSIHLNHNECVFLKTFSSFRVSCYQIVLSAQEVFHRALPNLYTELSVLTLYLRESVGPTTLGRDWALPCLLLNQYNNKIPKAINTITNYR